MIITSPPYNLDISYSDNKDDLSYENYLKWCYSWLKKCHSLAKSSGRLCVNLPIDTNLNGPLPIYSDLLQIALKTGWKYHTTLIWDKDNVSRRTAWGSWMSASAPYSFVPCESILVMYKDQWKKLQKGESTMTKEDFLQYTFGMWKMRCEKKKNAGGHPAPFPVELPRRLINFLSYKGDTILDPFVGSGSTLIACKELDRNGIGVDISQKYIDIAKKRLK